MKNKNNNKKSNYWRKPKYNLDSKITFGKHKNVKIRNINKRYLIWLHKERICIFSQEVLDFLKVREKPILVSKYKDKSEYPHIPSDRIKNLKRVCKLNGYYRLISP